MAQKLDLTAQTTISENTLSQQLIGYAIEVSSVALEEKKPVGRYSCSKIYATDGYDALSEYPCELIVHSDKGPIVVRYKEILPDTNSEIQTFLTENQMDSSLYYNNGRFRFALGEEDLARKNKENQIQEITTQTKP